LFKTLHQRHRAPHEIEEKTRKTLKKTLDQLPQFIKMPDISRKWRHSAIGLQENACVSSQFALPFQPRGVCIMAKAAKPAGKKSAKALTKSQFIASLAEKTALSKKQVDTVLTEIIEAIKGQLGSKGPGKFVFPGLARMTLTRREGQKGGVTKINPLTGKEYVTKDKPAYNQIKIRPIKAIKEALK
jgi:nucleoid DNA-binding protein